MKPGIGLTPTTPARSGKFAGEFGRLRVGATVVVQDRRPHRAVRAVDQDRAMHLAGEADRLQGGERLGGGGAKLGDRAGHR